MVSLAEQMGAMARVDELRYNQAEIQKHLDLPAHRQQVAERIREYYRSQGIEVQDALVDEGVRNFFASRLIYQAPSMGWLNRRLAQVYIDRGRWSRPAAIALAACLGFAVLLVVFKGDDLKSGTRSLNSVRELLALHADHVQQLDKRIAELGSDPLLNSSSAAQRLRTESQVILDKSRALGPFNLPEQANEQTLGADLKRAEAAREVVEQDQNSLEALDGQLDELAARATTVRPVFKQWQDARDSVRRMGLSAADAGQFQPLFAKTEQALRELDTAAAGKALEDVEKLRTVAATPLTLLIVSRTGEKSIVERNYDPNGSKSWYLITEATDSAGDVVSLPITSVETGERRYASVFGVRVSQALYSAVRNDKLEDGHVDDSLLGHKPANSLTLKFEKGIVKGKPEYILEW